VGRWLPSQIDHAACDRSDKGPREPRGLHRHLGRAVLQLQVASEITSRRLALLLQSRPPSPDPHSVHLLRGAPSTSCLADAAHLMLGGHKSKSCLDPNHSIDSPVGQVCHSRSSYWTGCSHHPATRGSPSMANIFLTTWHGYLRATTRFRLSLWLNTCYNSSPTTTLPIRPGGSMSPDHSCYERIGDSGHPEIVPQSMVDFFAQREKVLHGQGLQELRHYSHQMGEPEYSTRPTEKLLQLWSMRQRMLHPRNRGVVVRAWTLSTLMPDFHPHAAPRIPSAARFA
jgi:hypothetical protein